MNPLGSYTPVAGTDINIDTGLGWQYIRIINNSPYFLHVTFGGSGGINFPEMFLEDIYISPAYNGKLVITPIANFSAQAIDNALSSLISINAYQAGELKQPVAQPLSTVTGVNNQSVVVATQVVNTGNAAGANVVLGTPLNQATQLELNNDGSGFLAGGRIVYTASGAPETTNVDTTSFDQELAGYHTARAGGVTDWQLVMQASAHSELAWVSKGSPDVTALQISSLGQKLDNGQAFTDGFGNWSATTYLTVGGKQESGYSGFQFSGQVNGNSVGQGVNFKTVMTNTPTSITLSSIVNTNITGLAGGTIRTTGFFLQGTASAAAVQTIQLYTTVGN